MTGERISALEGIGERISALEGIGESVRIEREAGREAGEDARERARDQAEDPAIRRREAVRERDDKAAREKAAPMRDRAAPSSPDREVGREAPRQKAPEPEPPRTYRRTRADAGRPCPGRAGGSPS